MTSVGRKLQLNFSKGKAVKNDKKKVQDDLDVVDRRESWASGLGPPHKSNSMTNLHVDCGDGMLDHRDILQLTQFVRNFSEALYKLKEVFNFQNKPDVSGEEIRVQAHDKLGELLCQLGTLKKYPATLTSEVLVAAHNVITIIKKSSYTDVSHESVDILDVVDRLALAFSTSISEYLMGDMDCTSRIAKSKSCENLLAENQEQSFMDPLEKSSHSVVSSTEIDQSLLRIDKGVDIALNRAKIWSKYAKDITTYIEKRANNEAEFAKSLAKLANSVQQTITEESFLPFQSIYVMALNHDINAGSKTQATWHIIQTQKFIEPLNARRAEHEKIRKQLKDMWAREQKRMHDAVTNLKKAQTLYVTRHQEYDKAREATKKAESEGLGQSAAGAAKKEKKSKLEEEAMHKAMEAETTYKSCVVVANNSQHELEKVKFEILASTRELILESDKVMKTVTVGYFQLMQAASAPVPAQFQELCMISDRYEPGSQYTEFVNRMSVPAHPCIPESFFFEPYDRDPRAYETRKPSIQSSGSGSEIYGDDSPMGASHHLKVKHRHREDGDTDSISGSSSKSTSPTSSPFPMKRKAGSNNSSYVEYPESEGVAAVSSGGEHVMTTFAGMLLSAPARTHSFRKLRAPTRCRQCESYVYFQGAECEKCGISTHKKCLETLTYQCGGTSQNTSQQKGMTTFGVDFCTHCKDTKSEVPYIITKCTDQIEQSGIDMKGIYRVSGVKSKVEALCQTFETDKHQNVDLSEQNPHVISNVLKLYLRQLPEPLLTFRLYPLLIQLAKDEHSHSWNLEEMISRLKKLIQSLPLPVKQTLMALMKHLSRVKENEAENQMTASNLGIVFGPTLLRPSDGASSLNSLIETPHQTRIVELLILHCATILAEEIEVEKSSGASDSLSVSGSKSSTSDKPISPITPGTENWPVPEIQESLLDELVKAEPRFQQARAAAAAASNNAAVADGLVNLPGSVDTDSSATITATDPTSQTEPTQQPETAEDTYQKDGCCFDEEDLPDSMLPDHSNNAYVKTPSTAVHDNSSSSSNNNKVPTTRREDEVNSSCSSSHTHTNNNRHHHHHPLGLHHSVPLPTLHESLSPSLSDPTSHQLLTADDNCFNKSACEASQREMHSISSRGGLEHLKIDYSTTGICSGSNESSVSSTNPSLSSSTLLLDANISAAASSLASLSKNTTSDDNDDKDNMRNRSTASNSMHATKNQASSIGDGRLGNNTQSTVSESEVPNACLYKKQSVADQLKDKKENLSNNSSNNSSSIVITSSDPHQHTKKLLPSQVLRPSSKFYATLQHSHHQHDKTTAMETSASSSSSMFLKPQLTKPQTYSPTLPRRSDSLNISSLQQRRKSLNPSDKNDENETRSSFYAALDLSPTKRVTMPFTSKLCGPHQKKEYLKPSPNISPALSPADSPKCSPKGSPLPHRHSPLTLSTDRTPRYV